MLFRSLHANRHTVFIGKNRKTVKECTYLMEKPHSFSRTILSRKLHPLCKTNQQLVIWRKKSFSGTDPKVILNIKISGRKMLASCHERAKKKKVWVPMQNPMIGFFFGQQFSVWLWILPVLCERKHSWLFTYILIILMNL